MATFAASLRGIRRRMAATYVVGFFLAAAATPHHHLNPIGDLFSDDRSDSGVFVLGTANRPDDAPLLERLCLVDDDPCLACFQHDFVGTATSAFLVCCPAECFAAIDAASRTAVPELRAKSPTSRSPPVPA